MNRPTREQIMMEVCEVIAKRGNCQRGKVGCVITQDNRIVSTGYNGPVGLHNCEVSCDVTKACTDSVHAELNAIAAAAKQGVKLNGATLYCSTQPCINCARIIVQAGIRKVYYDKLYTNDLGSAFLTKNGVMVYNYNELVADIKQYESNFLTQGDWVDDKIHPDKKYAHDD